MPEAVLQKGQNVGLPGESARLRVVVGWTDTEGAGADVDGSALLLDSNRKVRSDDDLVFFNQPTSRDGSVQHLGQTTTDSGVQEGLGLDLEAVPADVDAIAVTASVGDGTFGDLEGLFMLVSDQTGQPLVRYEITDATTETAFVFGEVYRRNGSWKVRAVGQGWSTGLAGLATDFGVSVDDDAAPDATASEELRGVETDADRGSLDPDLHEASQASATSHEDGSEVSPPASAGRVGPRRARGVRTRKAPVPINVVSSARHADDPKWQIARLFSISGVGTADEQEKRATSTLLSTILSVKPLRACDLCAPGRASRCGRDVPGGSLCARRGHRHP